MTLNEHANRLCEAGNKGSLRGVHTILDKWYEQAYGELRAELDTMTMRHNEAVASYNRVLREKGRLKDGLNKISSVMLSRPPAGDPDAIASDVRQMGKVIDSLRAELDAERAQNKLLVEKIAKLPMGCSHCAGFGMLYSHGPYSVSISTCPHCKGSGKAVVTPPAPPADPDLDRIKQERRAEDRAVIDRIHAALSDGTCGLTPDAVFKLALKILKEQREKQPEPPEPPKKAVYEWRERVMQEVLYRDGNQIGACTTALKPISWNVFYADGMIRGVAHTIPLAKAAVEAVVRAHYGDEA